MKWTGLTGGIATGKSTASTLFESLGVPVIDADRISHSLTETGKVGYEKIVSHFGKSILNKDLAIDRKKLGHMVFSQPELRSELESILHPLIKEEVLRQKTVEQNKGTEICIYDVPLLFEKQLMKEFDFTVLIWCSPQVQLQRLMQRNNHTFEEAVLRVQNQLPMIDKVSMADYCVDNSGDKKELEKQIRKLLQTIRKI